jgi:AGZA family xanthine/uracil permease-like MFS transporter
MIKFLQNYFKLSEHHTSIHIEFIAALTTFVTMAYIIFVNPEILSQAGMNAKAVFVATCLIGAIGSFLIGILANYPIALAPGMGLNVYFVYIVARHAGYDWQTALGAVFFTGILFILLVAFKLHRKIIKTIPHTLIVGIIAGMGLLVALVALQNMHLIVYKSNGLFAFGTPQLLPVLLFLIGVAIIFVSHYFKIPGDILIGVLIVTIASLFLGVSKAHGFISYPPSIKPTLFAFSFRKLINFTGLGIVCTFFITTLFDTSGVMIGMLQPTKIPQRSDYQPRFAKALLANGITALFCGCLGTSVAATYVESSAGIHSGGRTGLTAIIIALLFLLALFFEPLTSTIPGCATAPVLIFIGYSMLKSMFSLDWRNITDIIPTLAIAIIIPLTTSIADGIGAGFITYIILKLMAKKFKELNVTLIVFAIIFLIYFMGYLL